MPNTMIWVLYVYVKSKNTFETMACCRFLGGWKQRAIRHRNGLLQSHWRLILTIALHCTGPPGQLAWFTISKTSRNGSLNPPISSFPSSKLIKKHLRKHLPCWLLPEDKMWEWKLAGLGGNRAHKGRALGRNLQIPKLRREVSNTENCSCPVFSAITGLRVTDLLAAQWQSCGGNVSRLTQDFLLYDQILPLCV